MKNSKIIGFKVPAEIFCATLLTILSLSSCGSGSVGVGGTLVGIGHVTPTQPTLSTIAATDSGAATAPYINANVQYFCDCQSGAAGSCVSGNDSSSGTNTNPRQSLDAAMVWLNGGTNRTAALCQGGSFAPGILSYSTYSPVYTLNSNSCPEGSICNELREYPISASGVKPIITNATGNHYLFASAQNSSSGGWRFMNLKLQGAWDTSTAHGNWGFQFYTAAGSYVHDIAIENVDMDSFDIGVNDATNANKNITFTGNHITNSSEWGFLGGNNDLTVSYNSFINNGSGNTFLHSIYFGSNTPISNVSIVGNFVSGFSTANGTKCVGEPIVGHGAVTTLVVSGNVVVEDTTADPQCYGISFSNGNSSGAVYYRDALFSDNIIVNGGGAGMAIDNCPYCMIENNLIIQQVNNGGSGIASPTSINRPQDDPETNATIVNNTVYFGVNNISGMQGGIRVAGEGSGYIVANNTIRYAGSSSALNGSYCLDFRLPNASYAYVNNNNCYSSDPNTKWFVNGVADSPQYTLAAWQAASGFDMNSSYTDPGWSFSTPLTIPAFDETKTGAQLFSQYFTPPAGSPLVGAGNQIYAPTLDITSTTTRANPPSIGAYR